MTPQKWFTSKTFWTLAAQLAANAGQKFGWWQLGDAMTFINLGLPMAAIAFRWVADQPLSV